MKEAKNPISDDEMRALLKKYPFLYRKNYWSTDPQPIYETEKENLESNWYREWEGTGWEDLWKRYLKHLFEWYDNQIEEVKKAFYFVDTKEKFGQMRIYTSVSTGDLEWIAEWLSSVTCQICGKVTKDPEDSRWFKIWRTGGWIANYCEECAKKYEREFVEQDKLDDMMVMVKNFGYKRYDSDTIRMVKYEDDGDGWLKKCQDYKIERDGIERTEGTDRL